MIKYPHIVSIMALFCKHWCIHFLYYRGRCYEYGTFYSMVCFGFVFSICLVLDIESFYINLHLFSFRIYWHCHLGKRPLGSLINTPDCFSRCRAIPAGWSP